jgi:hypothetical protein
MMIISVVARIHAGYLQDVSQGRHCLSQVDQTEI